MKILATFRLVGTGCWCPAVPDNDPKLSDGERCYNSIRYQGTDTNMWKCIGCGHEWLDCEPEKMVQQVAAHGCVKAEMEVRNGQV